MGKRLCFMKIAVRDQRRTRISMGMGFQDEEAIR